MLKSIWLSLPLLVVVGFRQPSDELGQAVPEGFSRVLVNEITWLPNPAVRGGELAILLGDPNRSGPLVVRVKFAPNIAVPPHTHPDARTYTVLSGEWRLGFGEKFDPAALRTFPAGSLYRLPAGVPHFQASGSSETIVQIESIGPTRTDFLPSSK
jgi:quercetin dioxygenase-like cupin family protein